MFHVGQKVVCVNDSDGCVKSLLGAGYTRGLRKGEIYTIASIELWGDSVFLRISEIEGPGGWCKSRFRPAVERKTDISIFTAMLTPSKITEVV